MREFGCASSVPLPADLEGALKKENPSCAAISIAALDGKLESTARFPDASVVTNNVGDTGATN
jgi:hypothetical protein